MLTTLVIGASTNPDRYAYKAIRLLLLHQLPVFAIGMREGTVHGIPISRPFPDLPPIDTVTLYIGKQHQSLYYDFILALNPRRVIFNPGSENAELEQLLRDKGIQILHDCTLVMLQQGSYA